MRLAREYEAHEGRDLRGFLELAAERTERDEREGMAAVQAEDHDGVRVMTVHAAKGLEFPVVAVPDLGRGAGRRAPPRRPGHRPRAAEPGEPGRAPVRDAARVRRRRSRSALWELDRPQRGESDAEAEEGCRLAYVAASRAAGPPDPQRRLQARPTSSRVEEPKPRRLGAAPAAARRSPRAAAGTAARDRHRARRRGRSASTSGSPTPRSRSGSPSRPERAAELVPALRSAARARAARRRGRAAAAARDRARRRCRSATSPTRRSPLTSAAATASTSSGCSARASGSRDAAGRAPTSERRRRGRRRAGRARARPRGLALGHRQRGPRGARVERPARLGEPPATSCSAPARPRGPRADAEARGARRELVAGWLGSTLRAELAGRRLRPEVPFVLELGGDRDPRPDRPAREPAGAAPTSSTTRPTRSRGRRAGRARRALPRPARGLRARGGRRPRTGAARRRTCFLEAPDDPVVETLDAGDLAAAREPARGADRRPDARRRASSPPRARTPALCYGCPAAARLCPHPALDAAPASVSRLAVFGYGSLVSPASAAQTLGRPVGSPVPARLAAGARALDARPRQPRRRRRPSPAPTARCPRVLPRAQPRARRRRAEAPNGALIELTEAELDRLDLREMRYDRVDVTERVDRRGATASTASSPTRPRPEHHAPSRRPDAVILATYPATSRPPSPSSAPSSSSSSARPPPRRRSS